MFYPEEIEQDLRCSFCRHKFTDVIKFLNCGESICGSCHDELRDRKNESRQFKCQACLRSHLMPEDGLPEVKSLARLIKRQKIEKPLSEQARTLKSRLAAVREQMGSLDAFEEMDHINQHCDQVESKVKEACEAAVKHFNQIQQDLLAEINEYRARCLQAFSARAASASQATTVREHLGALNKEIELVNSKWNEYFNRVEALASDDEVRAALEQVDVFATRLRAFEEQLKSDTFASQVVSFTPNESIFQEKSKWKESFHLSFDYTQTNQVAIRQVFTPALASHNQGSKMLFIDNAKLVSCAPDTTIRVWDFVSRNEIFQLKGHSKPVHSLALLPNNILASGSSDHTIRVWDLDKGREIMTLTGHAGSIVSMKVLKQGLLASYSLDETIKIWNIQSRVGALLRTIVGHGNRNWTIPFDVLANGFLVTFSKDPKNEQPSILRVWNPEDGQLVKEVHTGLRAATAMIAISDVHVGVGFYSGALKIIDLSDHTKTRTTDKAHDSYVSFLCMLSSGKLLSAGMNEKILATIKAWDPKGMCLLQTIPTDVSDVIEWINIYPDERQFVAGFRGKSIKLGSINF